MSKRPVYDAKLETQKQWNQDPCGAVTAGEAAPGTAEFYRLVEMQQTEEWLTRHKADAEFMKKNAGPVTLEPARTPGAPRWPLPRSLKELTDEYLWPPDSAR